MQTFMGASGGCYQFCHLDSYSPLSNSKYCKTGSKGTTQSKSVVNSGVHHRTSWTSPPRIGYVGIYVVFQLQLISQLVFLWCHVDSHFSSKNWKFSLSKFAKPAGSNIISEFVLVLTLDLFMTLVSTAELNLCPRTHLLSLCNKL
jgi:hypothetical protein